MTQPEHRYYLLRDGWRAIAKIFGLAVALDGIFQIIVFNWIYLFEAMLVGFLLACVPYILFRGLAGRLSGRAARGPR